MSFRDPYWNTGHTETSENKGTIASSNKSACFQRLLWLVYLLRQVLYASLWHWAWRLPRPPEFRYYLRSQARPSVVLRIEPRASCLLGTHSTYWVVSPALNCKSKLVWLLRNCGSLMGTLAVGSDYVWQALTLYFLNSLNPLMHQTLQF